MPWEAGAPQAGFSAAQPWLPVDPRHLPLAVDRQEGENNSTLALTRRLIALRKAHPALRHGAIRPVPAPPSTLAFERGEGAECLLCAFNLGDEPSAWRLPEGWEAMEQVGEPLQPLSGILARRRG